MSQTRRAVFAVAISSMVTIPAFGQGVKYPAARKDATVVDTYHGVQIPDPYRWLEEPDAPETREWIEGQNTITEEYLAAVPERDLIKARLTSLWNYERWGVPFKEGGKYFVTRNDGLQNQAPLYVMDTLKSEPRLLLDPNTLSKDGTVALAGLAVTEDGKHMAYGIAEAGSDWNTWKVRDIATGQDTGDEIKWVKFSGASWLKDGTGFFYSRFDEPKAGETLTGALYDQKVFFHKLGTPQAADEQVYDRPDHKTWGFGAGVTEDGRYLVMNVSDGTDTRNRFFYRDLSKLPIGAPAGASDARIKQAERTVRERSDRLEEAGKIGDPTLIAKEESIIEAESLARKNLVTKGGNTAYGFVELLNDFDASYDFIGNDGPTFYFRTDLEAPRGRVIAINVNHPERSAWQELVPQGAETLQGVSFVGGRFLASYLKDAQTQIRAFDTAGKAMGEVKLPGIGTAGGFGGKRGEMETFYSFASFTTPTTIYHYDIASGQSSVFKQPKVGFTGAEYQTRQVFVSSKDGTRVPMFITCKKDTKLDGSTPCMLYGYGGFNISLTPGFSPGNAVWLEMGGIYAVANLRGGGEYGEEWHQAGTKTRKQNVFDDFIACAEYLVKEKYTSTPKLAISGGSNGGLLVGACITQRPELFGAALPAVGVLDMLRFHRFTIGRAWCSDYGCAEGEDPAEFKALMAYSPLHNLRSGACYPTTMITTADHDDRVVPAHSFKFAAAIQAAQSCPNPVLIRIETKAGHGAGKPTAKVIEEKADQWAFLVRALDFVPTIKGGSAAAPKVSPSR